MKLFLLPLLLGSATLLHAELSLNAYNNPNPVICTGADGKNRADIAGVECPLSYPYNDTHRYQVVVYAYASDTKVWNPITLRPPNYAGVSPRWLIALKTPRNVTVTLMPYLYDSMTGQYLRVPTRPLTLQWTYHGACNTQSTVESGRDVTASFTWEGPGNIVININPLTLTGDQKSWSFTGKDYRGFTVSCGGASPTGVKGGWGTMACTAFLTSPSRVWHCNGTGILDWNNSRFAGQWAWFGMDGQTYNGQSYACVGTATGFAPPVTFGLVYLHSNLP